MIENTLPPEATPPRHHLTDHEGRIVGNRYRLEKRLGRGSSGAVYRAHDLVLDRLVALKLLHPSVDPTGRYIRREIAALSLLNIPGVVELLDHHVSDEEAWLVMELIEGDHFPSGDWEQLRETVLMLLETLTQVHTNHVIHRDLKPANVLVCADGRPVVLDFGLAHLESGERSASAGRGAPLGTPGYLSPEQLRGGQVDERTDVYSLGAMLYQSLSGELPYRADSSANLQAAWTRPLVPLQKLNPKVPDHVADLVERMLSTRPDERLSTRQALRALQRHLPEDALPRLGGDAPVREALARLAQRRLADVWGVAGSGRTRLLQDVASALDRALWLPASERPLGSLRPLLRLPNAAQRADVASRVADALEGCQATLIVDDWEALDASTRRFLEATPPPGGVLRMRKAPDAIRLLPLSIEDLKPLFTGPDRILHLRTDAAIELHRRTAGLPGEIAILLRRWSQAGVLMKEGDEWHIERAELDRLAAEPDQLTALPGSVEALPPDQLSLLSWCHFCWPNASRGALTAVSELQPRTLEDTLKELEAAGALLNIGGRYRPLMAARPERDPERRRRANRALAAHLPPGTPGRLEHLIPTGEDDALIQEALLAAANHERAGRLGLATAVLWEVSRTGRAPARALRRPLTRLLLLLGTNRALEQASFIARAAADLKLSALVDAHRLLHTGDRSGAERLLKRAATFSDPEVEMERMAALVNASRARPPEDQERLLTYLRGAPIMSLNAENPARCASWLGLVRFQQGRYAEAAQLHLSAVPDRATTTGRLYSLLNATRALLQDFALDRAEDVAERALNTAKSSRNNTAEADAEMLFRAIANRRGETEPCLDLLSCMEHLGNPSQLAQATIIEAFIAWRGGHPAAPELIRHAEQTATYARIPTVQLYARALRCVLEGTGDVAALQAEALAASDLSIRLDILGLLAPLTPSPLSPEQLQILKLSHPERVRPYHYGALAIGAALERLEPGELT